MNIGQPHANSSNRKPRLWDDKKYHLFAENINENELLNIKTCLENLTQQTASQEGINRIVDQIENLFTSSAKQSFGIKPQFTTKITATRNGLITSAAWHEMRIIVLENYIRNIKLLII